MRADNNRVRSLERKVKLLERAIRWLASEADSIGMRNYSFSYTDRVEEILGGNK